MGLWSHQLLSITPAENLVKNTGFGEGATNTKDPQIQPGIEKVGSLQPPYAARIAWSGTWRRTRRCFAIIICGWRAECPSGKDYGDPCASGCPIEFLFEMSL